MDFTLSCSLAQPSEIAQKLETGDWPDIQMLFSSVGIHSSIDKDLSRVFGLDPVIRISFPNI
jgi:hypothetical protein